MSVDVLLFFALALAGLWGKEKLSQIGIAGASIVALQGIAAHGWLGWQLGPGMSAVAFLIAFVVIGGALLGAAMFAGSRRITDDRIAASIRRIALRDAAGHYGWALVQQGILLAWLAQIDPVMAVLVFGALHWPNRFLVGLTLVGGAASVWIAINLGFSIPVAAFFHALMSTLVKSMLPAEWHRNMCAGRSCGRR